MVVLGTGAAQLDILFQIGSARTIYFNFGIDVSAWTFELVVKSNKGSRTKMISLTNSSGLSFYSTQVLKAAFSTTNTTIDEAEYYYELRRTDTSISIVNGLAIFSYNAPAGTTADQELSFSNDSQTVTLDITNTPDLTQGFSSSVSSSTYSIQTTDANNIIPVTTTCTITVPPSFDTGFQCEVFNEGAGTVTFSPGSGVIIRSEGLNLATQYTAASLVHKGSNVWYIVGKLT